MTVMVADDSMAVDDRMRATIDDDAWGVRSCDDAMTARVMMTDVDDDGCRGLDDDYR